MGGCHRFGIRQLENAAAAGEHDLSCPNCLENEPDYAKRSLKELAPDIAMEDIKVSRIDMDDLQIAKKIGRGSFGNVYMGVYNGSKKREEKKKKGKRGSGIEEEDIIFFSFHFFFLFFLEK